LRIELQGWVRPQDDPAIAGAGDRGADDRLAEAGTAPPDRNTPVGIVHLNDDVATALRSGEFCQATGRSPTPSMWMTPMPCESATGDANAIPDLKTESFEPFPLPNSYASVRQLAGRKGEV